MSTIIHTCPKCGGDLEHIVFATYPPISSWRCPSCGWSFEQQQTIKRVPFETQKEVRGMSELIDRRAFIEHERKLYCDDCDRRKGTKNGRKVFCYDVGGVPCRACWVEDVLGDLEDSPTASPWRKKDNPPKYSGKVFVLMEREGPFYDVELVADTATYNRLPRGSVPVGIFYKGMFGESDFEDITQNVLYWMPVELPEGL